MMPGQPPAPLPLREDLRLYETAPDRDGGPCWVIQDPVTNRFYRVGWFEYECLLRWPGDPARIAADIAARTTLQVDAGHVLEFAEFLEQNRLVRPSPEGLQRLKQQANAPGWRHWKWWLHHYLFVRVPLVRPHRFLARLLPWVEPLFTRTALILLIMATLLGLALVMRQWDSFTHSVMDLISPAGIAGFVLAMVVSKTLHEMGHALVATRQGLRVAHMGVAFVVLWPMLYTDTGESWRLRSHRQRLAISVAGVSVELALAGMATLAWAVLDDGMLRQSMLYLATTAWVLSLALNVSPFMRFDGYFILSDVLNYPNLHERAGAMARTWLRRGVLGLPDPYPEVVVPRVRRTLIVFALLTWLYRLVVFLGIAWAVYAMFFKVLGIFLLVVEILWFVLRPIWQELKVWHERWPEVARSRKAKLWGVLLAVLLLLAVPWKLDVRAPAVAQPVRQQIVFGPMPAQVTALREPARVTAGQNLAVFTVPELNDRGRRISAAINALERRLAGLMADDAGMAHRGALLRQLGEQRAELAAIDEERARLSVRAAFDGDWLDVDPMLGPGSWVDARTPLGVLVDAGEWVVEAYVDQRDVARLQPGAQARFYFSGESGGVAAQVEFIDPARSQRLAHVMLDGNHGGPIPTQAGQQEGMPVDAVYRVRLRLEEPLPGLRETRGRVAIEGERRSLLWQGAQRVASVLIRESGF
ncbi:HlyD family efflux transporter periplasmic adaptor subunit [Pusillimonas sp.]|uniref:HlyD family efflux transporter periplasmic adaptor subunit n=1 Tax=Pusillimonas sp. TaxID=3040095 RepID=UPI0037C76FCF